MLILLFALAAIACGALAVRLRRDDRADPTRRAFARLTWLLTATYATWALYLVSKPLPFSWGEGLRYLNGIAGASLPLALLRVFDRLFAARKRPPGRLERIAAAGPVWATACMIGDLWWRSTRASHSPFDILLGSWIFLAFLLPLRRLWSTWREARHPSDRARMRYLLGLAGAAVLFSALEAVGRGLEPAAIGNADAPASAGWFDSAVTALQHTLGPIYTGQGPVPPLGALFATLFVYFLYQMISMSRLLELNEIFGRLAAVSVLSSILVIVLLLIAAFSATTMLAGYASQALYEAFIASCLLTLAADPIRQQVEAWTDRIFNARREQLFAALARLDVALDRVISVAALVDGVLNELMASGRFRAVTLYIWSEAHRAYRLVGERAPAGVAPIPRVPRQPFADGFAAGESMYVLSDLSRDLAQNPSPDDPRGIRRHLMMEMAADVAIPLFAGDVVIGWVGLGDEEWSDGFSRDELGRVSRTLGRVAATLENIQSFDALKEEYRLAALGTMSAGLAHEIRNPLAAIKGAAQLLQGDGQAGEFVEVIVNEVDRLNTVVTQFLDYARPLQLHREAANLGDLVGLTARLVVAGVDAGHVRVLEDVEPELPPVDVDPGKIRQVLLNLCQNALQAMRDGGTLTLRVQGGNLRDPKARNAPALEIHVVDTGVGVAREDLDKLFVPFFTTRHDGTGLGLAISRRIVREHGGELDVQSEIGRGTTFVVRLPLRI